MFWFKHFRFTNGDVEQHITGHDHAVDPSFVIVVRGDDIVPPFS